MVTSFYRNKSNSTQPENGANQYWRELKRYFNVSLSCDPSIWPRSICGFFFSLTNWNKEQDKEKHYTILFPFLVCELREKQCVKIRNVINYSTYGKSKLELAHVLFPPISKEIGGSYKIGIVSSKRVCSAWEPMKGTFSLPLPYVHM